MMKKVFIPIILIVILLFISCTTTEKLVIDGSIIKEMESDALSQLFDYHQFLRGNSPSNIRNGGYIIRDGERLLFTTTMTFDDGSETHYLQSLHLNQIGSLNTPNDLIAPLNGKIIGQKQNSLFFLNSDDNNTLYCLDLESFETKQLYDKALDEVHLFNNNLYVSTLIEGDFYKLELVRDKDNRYEIKPSLISLRSGLLIGVDYQNGYLTSFGDLRVVDLNSKSVKKKIVGGPYRDAQINASTLFYKKGDTLYRKSLTNNSEEVAFNVDVDQYNIWGTYLVATSASKGGIYLSRLDGSKVEKISDDIAKDLQILDHYLFYKNVLDNDSIYVIDLIDKTRSALLGSTLTDGGLKFVPVASNLIENNLKQYVSNVYQKTSLCEFYSSFKGKTPLFAQVNSDATISYFKYIDSSNDFDSVVVINSSYVPLGHYTDGSTAYRHDWLLTLFNLDFNEPALTIKAEGSPPTSIKTAEGDRVGLPISWHQKALEIIKELR
jgi:hypothetical protein